VNQFGVMSSEFGVTNGKKMQDEGRRNVELLYRPSESRVSREERTS
jgi:hypothetical protein